MKNIWLVEPYAVPSDTTSRVAILAHYIERAGYKAWVVCSNTDCKYNPQKKSYSIANVDGVDYLLINREIRAFHSVKRVIAQMRFQNDSLRYGKLIGIPDLIINNFAGIFGDFAFKYRKRYGTKIMLDILDLWPEVFVDLGHLRAHSAITKYLYHREHISYRECDSLFFSMQGGKDYIIEKGWNLENGGDIDLSKVHYMQNGIDLSTVDYDRIHYSIEDADLESKRFKVTYVGAIGAPNDIETIVRTAQVASENNIDDIVFLIYGDGSALAGARDLARRLGLSNIKFKGALDKRYAPYVESMSDIGLLNFAEVPTLRFGLSNNKFYMYCANSLPTLSTVHPAYSEIEKSNCGIVTAHDPKSILDGVLRFKGMPQSEMEGYRSRARKVGEEYDYSFLFKEMQEQIDILLSN